MLILEKGDSIRYIYRYLKSGHDEVNYICVSNFESIDIDKYDCINITVNSDLRYSIGLNMDSKKFLNKILISEFRDKKINDILST